MSVRTVPLCDPERHVRMPNFCTPVYVHVGVSLSSPQFVSAILGPERAAPILWAPGKMRSFGRKTYVLKIPRFRWGIFWVWRGEGPILFYGRGDFSDLFPVPEEGPESRDMSSGYGFPLFVGRSHPPPAWTALSGGQQSFPNGLLLEMGGNARLDQKG